LPTPRFGLASCHYKRVAGIDGSSEEQSGATPVATNAQSMQLKRRWNDEQSITYSEPSDEFEAYTTQSSV